MKMTPEQSNDFNALTRKQKEFFARSEMEHPNWNFNQVMSRVVFQSQMDTMIDNGGQNVNSNDPSFWIAVLEGAKSALIRFKSIGKSIISSIDATLVSLKTMIILGIKNAGKTIKDLFGKIF